MFIVEEYVEVKLEICMLLLGMVFMVLGEEEEGLYYLEIICKMFEFDFKLWVFLYDMQKVFVCVYGKGFLIKDYCKVVEMYEVVLKIVRDLYIQLVMDMDVVLQWIKVLEECVSGMEKI